MKRPSCALLLATALIAASLAHILVGCAAPPFPPISMRVSPNRIFEEDDIRESVFRYLISSKKFRGPVYLSIDGSDPTDAFMSRFHDIEMRPKEISRSYFRKKPFPGWLRDRATYEKGVAFNVSSISWISPLEVKVSGGSYCGGLCADAGIFEVSKRDGHWTVKKYEIRAIS